MELSYMASWYGLTPPLSLILRTLGRVSKNKSPHAVRASICNDVRLGEPFQAPLGSTRHYHDTLLSAVRQDSRFVSSECPCPPTSHPPPPSLAPPPGALPLPCWRLAAERRCACCAAVRPRPRPAAAPANIARRLPGVPFPRDPWPWSMSRRRQLSPEPVALVIVAAPSDRFRQNVRRIAPNVYPKTPSCSALTKGLELPAGLRMSEVLVPGNARVTRPGNLPSCPAPTWPARS